MKRLSSNLIGVDQGDHVLFSDFEHEGEMWTGTGPRERRAAISFSESFRWPPAVQLSLSLYDVSNSATTRADVKAENVSETGFDMVFRTWGDTKVARVRISWIAIGELPNPDDWQVD